MSRPGPAPAHWSKRPTGAKVHALMQDGFRGTAVEVAAKLGISRMSAERQLNAMVSAGDGHIFDRLPIAKNGPPPAHYAYGPAPSADDDSDDSGPVESRAHVINQAIRQAERGHITRIINQAIRQAERGHTTRIINQAIRQAKRGHTTRIIMSGIQIWHRSTGLDPIALRRLDQAVRL